MIIERQNRDRDKQSCQVKNDNRLMNEREYIYMYCTNTRRYDRSQCWQRNYYFRLVTRAAERWPEIVIEKVMNSNSNLITQPRSINSNFVRTNRPCYIVIAHGGVVTPSNSKFLCELQIRGLSVSLCGRLSRETHFSILHSKFKNFNWNQSSED